MKKTEGRKSCDTVPLTTNFASFEPVLQKPFFSDGEGEVEAKPGFFQQQVLLYSKHVFG
jgi:hypothetical protein